MESQRQTTRRAFYARSRERGAVLAVGLILLAVLTLIGVTGMRMTVIEEKMAGNMRDRSLAFQAAEAAVRDAETTIEGLPNLAGFSANGNGLLGEVEAEPDYFDDTVWVNASSEPYSASMQQVSAPPRYIAKLLGTVDINIPSSINVQNYGGAPLQVGLFKVTARGAGRSANSRVLLQTHYGRLAN